MAKTVLYHPKSTKFYKEMNSEPHKKLVDFFKPQNFGITRKMHFYRLQQNVSTQFYCCVRQWVQPSTAVLYLKNIFCILIKNVT